MAHGAILGPGQIKKKKDAPTFIKTSFCILNEVEKLIKNLQLKNMTSGLPWWYSD